MNKITKALSVAVLLVPAFTLSVANAGEKKGFSKKEKKCHILAAAKTGLGKEKDPKKKAAAMQTKKYLKAYNDCMKGRSSGMSMPRIPKF